MSDQSEGSVAQVKRKDDPENEDHRRERRFDWRELAPRWFLVWVIGIGLVFIGWMGGRMNSLDDERIAALAAHQNDSRWELLSRHSDQINDLRGEVRRHGDRLDKLDQMSEDVRKIRILAEEDAKRSRRNGGVYGMP